MRGSHESYCRVGETCPEVWRQVGSALEKILPFLNPDTLREAVDAAAQAAQDYGACEVRKGLIDCEAELLDALQEIKELKSQIELLREESKNEQIRIEV